MDRKIKRLISATHKRIDNLGIRSAKLDVQVQELFGGLKQLQEELKAEKKFVAAAIREGEAGSKVVIYDNEAYWGEVERRQAQLQEVMDKCRAELAEVQMEIEKEYQLQEQYQILLDRSLAEQILKLNKEEQDELDEHATRKLTSTNSQKYP